MKAINWEKLNITIKHYLSACLKKQRESILALLPPFIHTNIFKNIIDAFEVLNHTGEDELAEDEFLYL